MEIYWHKVLYKISVSYRSYILTYVEANRLALRDKILNFRLLSELYSHLFSEWCKTQCLPEQTNFRLLSELYSHLYKFHTGA